MAGRVGGVLGIGHGIARRQGAVTAPVVLVRKEAARESFGEASPEDRASEGTGAFQPNLPALGPSGDEPWRGCSSALQAGPGLGRRPETAWAP